MAPEMDPAARVPVIDLQGPHDEVVQQVRDASIQWGGFQIINHGVPKPLMERMRSVAREFFALPVEEKWTYSNSVPTSTVDLFYGYGTKERGTKGALDRGDQLRHKTRPLSERAYEQWPTNPASYRETEEEYLVEHDKLSKQLLELLSEGLGVAPSRLWELLGEEYQQVFLVNHYLPSGSPAEPTDGLQKHSDFSALTILMQNVAGLQFRKDNQWCPVEPIPDAYVINLGDQIEIWTNGLYKSPEHRALLHPAEERFSIASFACPRDEQVISPLAELVSEANPVKYKTRTYAQYRTEVMTIPYMAKTLCD